jgi:hypothetical protein
MLINPEDPRYISLGEIVNCFSKSINLFPYIVESIEIPYKGTTLSGYFYYYKCRSTGNNYFTTSNTSIKDYVVEKSFNPSSSSLPSSYPTLIVHGGFDSTLEELYSSAAAPALERGYNCLTIKGLGQGRVIRKQKIPFRSDWEKVVSSVIDYVINRKQKFWS